MRLILGIATIALVLSVGVMPALAHVAVKPSQVGVAVFQTFMMGVPNEKDNPMVSLRLVLPDGLKEVSPNVKSGWTVTVKKDGTGDDAKVTEIDWTGGSIPVGQRDDFYFSAQVPSTETTLTWKAYQTYQNGEIVSWDQDPSQIKSGEEGTPFSQTKVINDLTANSKPVEDLGDDGGGSAKMAVALSGLAVLLSVISIGMQFRKR